jgi:hypothetical protein
MVLGNAASPTARSGATGPTDMTTYFITWCPNDPYGPCNPCKPKAKFRYSAVLAGITQVSPTHLRISGLPQMPQNSIALPTVYNAAMTYETTQGLYWESPSSADRATLSLSYGGTPLIIYNLTQTGPGTIPPFGTKGQVMDQDFLTTVEFPTQALVGGLADGMHYMYAIGAYGLTTPFTFEVKGGDPSTWWMKGFIYSADYLGGTFDMIFTGPVAVSPERQPLINTLPSLYYATQEL